MLVYKQTFDGYVIPTCDNHNVARLRDVIGEKGAAGAAESLALPGGCAAHLNCSVWLHHFCCLIGSRLCAHCSRLSNSILDCSTYAIINTPFVHLLSRRASATVLCLLYLNFEWRIVSYDRVDDMKAKHLERLSKHEAHFFLLNEGLYYVFSQNSRLGTFRVDERLSRAFPGACEKLGAEMKGESIVFLSDVTRL